MTNTGIGHPNAEDAKVSQKSQKEQPNFENDFSHEVIGAAVEVQRVLGTGLLESAYAAAMAIELHERELSFERDVPVEAIYKGRSLGVAYRANFVVEGSVLLELKAMDAISDMHRAQLLSYLRVSRMKLGLLINFHTFPVVKGIHRVVNKL
jgi:GxxExxY protein